MASHLDQTESTSSSIVGRTTATRRHGGRTEPHNTKETSNPQSGLLDQSQAYIPTDATSRKRSRTHTDSRQRRRHPTIPLEGNEDSRMNIPQRSRTRRESRGESESAGNEQIQHSASSGPMRTHGNASYVVHFLLSFLVPQVC
jgi:hypothetical protein